MVSATLQEQLGARASTGRPAGWPWRFLMFSVLVAACAGVSVAGLALGYRPFLESRIAAQDAEIAALGKKISAAEQARFVRFYSQLVNLDRLLKRHVVITPLFDLIESRTHPQVMYAAMEARVADRKVVLEGSAASYRALADQLEIFSATPEIARVIVNDSSALDGKVRFRLTLTARAAVFNDYEQDN
jgi:hypothetical protein